MISLLISNIIFEIKYIIEDGMIPQRFKFGAITSAANWYNMYHQHVPNKDSFSPYFILQTEIFMKNGMMYIINYWILNQYII